jgi:hypothetical protein
MNWPLYNESLVRRGQVLLDFDVLDRWYHELSQMNRSKVGEHPTIIQTPLFSF